MQTSGSNITSRVQCCSPWMCPGRGITVSPHQTGHRAQNYLIQSTQTRTLALLQVLTPLCFSSLIVTNHCLTRSDSYVSQLLGRRKSKHTGRASNAGGATPTPPPLITTNHCLTLSGAVAVAQPSLSYFPFFRGSVLQKTCPSCSCLSKTAEN